MPRNKTVGMTVTDDEYMKLISLRIKDGEIRSLSEVLREIVIPALNNGHNPIDNKQEAKPIEQQDSEPVAKQEDEPPVNDFFKDVTF